MIGRGTRLLELNKIKPWCREKDVFQIIDCWDIPDAFELEYLIPNNRIIPRDPWPKQDDWPVFHIRIIKEKGQRPGIHWLNKLSSGEVTETELTRTEVKAYLPTYVLGYSSGHNEILSLPFFKMRFINFDEYRDRLIKDLDYDGKPEGRMIYLDDQFSQAILLCHFLFPNEAILRVSASHSPTRAISSAYSAARYGDPQCRFGKQRSDLGRSRLGTVAGDTASVRFQPSTIARACASY